jgi:hypothetical protein
VPFYKGKERKGKCSLIRHPFLNMKKRAETGEVRIERILKTHDL